MPRSSAYLLLSSAAALLATQVLAAAPTISSPNVYQCSPTTSYQVTCDDPPCQVVARPEGNPSQSLAVIGTVDTAGPSTLPWKASVPEGTSIVVYITDNSGVVGNNSPTVVFQGTQDCDGSSPSSGSDSSSTSTSATESANASESSSSSSSAASSESSSSSSAASSGSSSSASVSTTSPSQSQSTTNTATGTAPASSATPTDTGSTASGFTVGGGLFAGALAVAIALDTFAIIVESLRKLASREYTEAASDSAEASGRVAAASGLDSTRLARDRFD
ncbi:hypothetical protein JCM11491_005963 [Sporobolomyces phaffii]